jgi:hypothetical protein
MEDMNRGSLKLAAFLSLMVVGLVLEGCGESRAPYAGTYHSVETYAGGKSIELDLKENGKGTWTMAGKGTEFTWVVNHGRLWFYTKSGAILIITPSDKGNTLSADMSGDWHPGCPMNECVIFKRFSKEGG